jgi:cytoskeletal protein RodZ
MSTQQFGGWLRHVREARGLTVEAIASQTKIPPRHIEALERGDGLALPAFYQRAEVRTVARAVGVDPQLALARLEAELAPVAQSPVAQAPPAPTKPVQVSSSFVFALVAMFVVVFGLASWRSFERTIASKGAAETPAFVTAPPAALLPSEVAGAPTLETVADSAPAPSGPTELAIRTQPEGARVTVNGIGWGTSPVIIRHLEPGEKRIRVTMDGYAASERSVTIDEGRRETIRIRLSSNGS